jgi:thiamine kinase-like enzyme
VHVYSSLEALLATLESRRPFKTSDSLSGSRFEAVRSGGKPMILKYVCVDDDWIMRASGDLHCRQLTLFESGVLDRLPASIDHATVSVAPYVSETGHRGGAFLMNDVAARLVHPGSDVIDLETHLRFMDHMSALHAAYWTVPREHELFPMMHHFVLLTPTMAALERERGGTDPVPPAVLDGWSRLHTRWPKTARILGELARDPSPLVAALAATPSTFIHGDWKFGNLGEHADGRTILLDWDRSGYAAPTLDLAWYVGVNCDRLSQTKEETIASYRHALSAHGIATEGWWDHQLAVALLAVFLMLAWSKTEQPEEFGWWQDRLDEGLKYL